MGDMADFQDVLPVLAKLYDFKSRRTHPIFGNYEQVRCPDARFEIVLCRRRRRAGLEYESALMER